MYCRPTAKKWYGTPDTRTFSPNSPSARAFQPCTHVTCTQTCQHPTQIAIGDMVSHTCARSGVSGVGEGGRAADFHLLTQRLHYVHGENAHGSGRITTQHFRPILVVVARHTRGRECEHV